MASDQVRSGLRRGVPEGGDGFVGRMDGDGRHAHPSARRTKSRSGRDRSSSSLARGPPSPAPVRASSMLRMAYERLFMITGRHVELLAGVGPQRLDRVHRGAVGLEGEHRPVGTRHRGARGQREPDDRSPRR